MVGVSAALCTAFLLAAYKATSPDLLIVLIGIVGGLFTSMNMMYTYNLVGRSFRRFRPIAFGIVNLGAPAGNAVMPIIASAFIREYGLVQRVRPSLRPSVRPHV